MLASPHVDNADSAFYTLLGTQKVPEFLIHIVDRCRVTVDPAADPDTRIRAHQERLGDTTLTAARRDPRTTGWAYREAQLKSPFAIPRLGGTLIPFPLLSCFPTLTVVHLRTL